MTTITIEPHANNLDGLRRGLRTVGELIVKGMKSPRILVWARQAVYAADLALNASPSAIADALYAALNRDTTFVQDPYLTEFMVSAEQLLCLDPNGYCVRAGDCDDRVIALGSALMSVGIPVQLCIRSYPKMDQLHLMLRFDSDIMKRGKWVCFDATSPTGACFVGHDSELIVDLEVGSMVTEQEIIIMGAPPVGGSSSSSSAGASSAGAVLTAEQTAAWLALAVQAKAQIEASIAGVAESTAMLDAIRGELGLPVVDAPPAGGEAAGVSPLQTYGQTFLWTAKAQNAQAKLVQTASFCVGVLDDAIAGRRALYWHEGDLYVTALAGDAYGVLMKPIPGGTALVPTYVDLSTGNATGQVGFGVAPVIIGIGIVALAVAAAYGVSKLCDYLASAHRDDAVQKIADAQQALVASGAQTPEQAQAFLRAAADLTSAPPPGASKGLGWSELLAAGAVGLALGVAGSFVAGRVLSGVRLAPSYA